MKAVRKILDSLEKNWFAEGKPLAPLYPLYDAADTFFFTPNAKTSGTCAVRDCVDFKRMMITVVLALLPCALMGMYNVGFQANSLLKTGAAGVPTDWHGAILNGIANVYPAIFEPSSVIGCFLYGLVYFLPIYIVTMIVGLGWEILFASINKHEVNEGFFVTGFLFPLIVPATIPLWQVALAISFGVVIGKEIFGGTGRNFMNPALVARAFLFFAYAGQISGDKVWTAVDGVSKATPLSFATQGVDALSAQYSMSSAFFGTIPGSLGETSTLACLIGAAILLLTGVASWRIMASMFVGGMGLAAIFASCPSITEAFPAATLGPCWHFVLGGFAFGMVFMATDPVTAAATKVGQYIYGFLMGALIIVVRAMNPAYPEGVMLVILFGNCVAPLIDYTVVSANVRRRVKRLEAR
ncbi:MAG: NADH:ubiquinone reductase (Na(+)-transporting) subunit B [Thermoguttaceae bacterium]|nr:NADH:ubiquinone reductase (Na(+)-transporting) subunit B [Thermoguttaceae bacterium]